ncbi:MAG: glycerol-3-phosphate acyltransferase [Ruminococcus sp.]|nr:glycerol-3-phosphate acyltransferase [Ruminococcus sp.]
MKIAIFFIAAVCAYLLSGVNPAIVLSKLIYHQDIRELGSKNPGFTNFKRVFGSKYAWFVFVLDILKSVVLCLVFGYLFDLLGLSYQLGVAFTGLFAMLGHAYPVWYHLDGGKAFLVAAAAIFFIDWRVGLIAMGIMMILLFTVKYMSLSVIVAALSCPITLALFGADSIWVIAIVSISTLFLIYRHKENIKRLFKGTESKFSLLDKKKEAE